MFKYEKVPNFNVFSAFLLQIFIFQSANAQLFSPFSQNSSFTQVYNGNAAWGDFDNDGDLDIFVNGVYTSTAGKFTGIYRNDNDSFVLVSNLPFL